MRMESVVAMGQEPKGDWWNVRDVASFLGIKPSSAKVWMWRNNVRRCKGNNRLTHKSWVEACLVNGKRPERKKRVTLDVLGRPIDLSVKPTTNQNKEGEEQSESNHGIEIS
jgi:hypothetical protein